MKMHYDENRTKSAAEMTYMATVCVPTGAIMCVPVSGAMAARYSELHSILPQTLTAWPEDALDDLLEELEDGDVEAYQRVLILLAHHQSLRASQIIKELMQHLPTDLVEFAEMAYAESLGWLGWDYVRQFDWEAPLILPAGSTGDILDPKGAKN